MSWLTGGPTTRDEMLARRPELADAFRDVSEGLWDGSVDPRPLELCRLRTAKLVGSAAALAERTPGVDLDEETIAALAAWPTDHRFDETDRACLAYAEQFVLDVHGITDELNERVASLLGPKGMITFTTALAVWELSHRFDAGLGIADTSPAANHDPTSGGR